MMIAQYVAAPSCAENKQLAQPAVLDSFVTSALQEDRLSLGTSVALKLQCLLGNLYQVLGTEYLLAAQGLDFYEPQTLAAGTCRARDLLRQSVPGWEEGRWLALDITSAVAILKRNAGHALA